MTGPLARLRELLARGLEQRRVAGLGRTLTARAGLDLSSNDVLGYAEDPWIAEQVAQAVRAHGTGSGAARLLRGNLPIHEECERRLAEFSGREAALLFPSGYMANLGLLGALGESLLPLPPLEMGARGFEGFLHAFGGSREGTMLSDRENHASLIDGFRLARCSGSLVDADHLVSTVPPRTDRGRPRVLVLESVYSTSGRMPDLVQVCAWAEREDVVVVVDEAHATGLFGARGSGRVEALGLADRVLATVHTGGKALGVAGAWVAGDRVLIEHLVNHARAFVFTTAPMPALAAGLIAALDRRAQDPDGPAKAFARAAQLRERLRAGGLEPGGDGTHIVPLVLGENARAVAVARALQAEGFDVRALRPPTVPEGTARLRLMVRRDLGGADVERLAERVLHHVRGTAP
jgi:8-amino-7-oxononanoate synthase